MLLLLTLAACKKAEPQECTATVSDTVTTVVGLDWTAPEGSESYVEFGETEGYGFTTPTVSGTDMHFDLAGVPAETKMHWRGVTTTDDGTVYECSGVTETGSVPSDIPTVSVTEDKPGQDDAPFVIGAYFQGAGGSGGEAQLVAYNRKGEIVWYYQGPDESTAMDVHFPHDGNGLLYSRYDDNMGGDGGYIQRISLAGETLAEFHAPTMHHMFCELPDGTLAYQGLDSREYTYPGTGETDEWVGDTIVEIAADGTTETVFTVWDWLTPELNDRVDGGSIYPGVDWTHGNMVGYYPDTDEYLLSLGHADDILMIDRATMTPNDIWGVDGVAASPPFDYQHGVNRLDNGNMLMFMSEDSGAGAIEYEQVDGALEEVWRSEFGRKPFALGQATRLGNGNTFVNSGAGGVLTEVKPDGSVIWQMEADEAAFFAQFQLVDSLYAGK